MPASTEEIMARERFAMEEAYCKGNLAPLDEVFIQDVIFHIVSFADFKGLDLFKHNATVMHEAFSNMKWEWDEVIIEGDTAVQRYTLSMKHTGEHPLFPIPPTRKVMTAKGCVVYHLDNGKIVEFFEFSDILGFYQQLGIVPPMRKKQGNIPS
jgi:predicted ester cyclase